MQRGRRSKARSRQEGSRIGSVGKGGEGTLVAVARLISISGQDEATLTKLDASSCCYIVPSLPAFLSAWRIP